MVLAIDAPAWQRYDPLDARQLAQMLLRIAAHADPRALRSHPRGPKLRSNKKYVSRGEAQRHVATARVLKHGKMT